MDIDVVATTTTGHGVYRVRLEQDIDTPDPRVGDDHAGTFVLRHRRYNLPLEGALTAEIDAAMHRGGYRLAERYLQGVHAVPAVLPVWGYEHGDLVLHAGERVGAFTDTFDSGLAGLAYITSAEVQTRWTDHGVAVTADELVAVLRAELDEYNAWATGDVYSVIVEYAGTEDAPWEELNSCWGHIGHDWATQAAGDALAAAVQDGVIEHARRQAAATEDTAEIESLRTAELGGAATTPDATTGV